MSKRRSRARPLLLGALLLCAALALAPAAAGGGSIVTGLGAGGAPQVAVFDAATAARLYSFFAYTPSFAGGVRVAAGDVNGDGVPDIVTGSGPGVPAHVKVFDGVTGLELRSFFAFAPGSTGGVFVAAGDVDGDGRADLVAGADAGGSPHVKVFDGATGVEVRSFFAYPPSFTGGVRVAAGDVNGDGVADVVTATGPGVPAHVKVFDGATGAEIRSFFAFDPGFTGGVFVAAGDVNGDGSDDLVVGVDQGPAHVKVFDGATGAEIRSFFAFDPGFLGGVRVAAGDVNGDGVADIVTAAGPGGGPHVKVFDGLTGAEIGSFFSASPAFGGGVYVAAAAPFNPSDTEAPVLTLPSGLTIDATGPAGAIVTFEASALDVVDGPVPVTCRPPSGSTFPIGDTTVECSASDAAGHISTSSFVVHVRGAAEQLDRLHALITGFGLERSVTAVLQNKVTEVERALAEHSDACTKLDQVLLAAIGRAGSGDGELPFADALQLLDATNTIGIVLGCVPEGSALPAVQHELVELLETIDGMGLRAGEESALQEKTRKAAEAAVRGSPCAALDRLAAKISADTGRTNKLTESQGAALSAAVAAVVGTAGCL